MGPGFESLKVHQKNTTPLRVVFFLRFWIFSGTRTRSPDARRKPCLQGGSDDAAHKRLCRDVVPESAPHKKQPLSGCFFVYMVLISPLFPCTEKPLLARGFWRRGARPIHTKNACLQKHFVAVAHESHRLDVVLYCEAIAERVLKKASINSLIEAFFISMCALGNIWFRILATWIIMTTKESSVSSFSQYKKVAAFRTTIVFIHCFHIIIRIWTIRKIGTTIERLPIAFWVSYNQLTRLTPRTKVFIFLLCLTFVCHNITFTFDFLYKLRWFTFIGKQVHDGFRSC